MNDLEQRLRILENEVFGGNAYAVSSFDRIAEALRDHFALTRTQAMILRRLLLSDTPVDAASLDEIIEANSGYKSSEKQFDQRVYYHISKIRGVVGLHGVIIDRIRDVGYKLSKTNQKRVMKIAGISRIRS